MRGWTSVRAVIRVGLRTALGGSSRILTWLGRTNTPWLALQSK
jgi:hypothetical protein